MSRNLFERHLCYGCDEDTLELDGYEATPFIVSDLEAWCDEWEIDNYNYIHKLPEREEAKTWIVRGLALAQQLRQIMPDEVVLLFRQGDKDLMLEKITYFFLFPDTHWAIGDTSAETVEFDGDEIQIADFLTIKLPGFDKWYKEFDSRADYVKNTVVPDFDWHSWNLQGIHFASIIRKHLPETVAVWYRTPFELRSVGIQYDLRFTALSFNPNL